MKTLANAFKHRGGNELPPYRTIELMSHFDYEPRKSLVALLRKTGPFLPAEHAFKFTNGTWPITDEDAEVLRRHYKSLFDPVVVIGIASLRAALFNFSFPVYELGSVRLPVSAVDFVVDKVTADLRNKMLDKIIAAIPGEWGRCGGMAFAGYDFFLCGKTVPQDTLKPASGILRDYIWTRLINSLELNALTFLEWGMILHVLPVISVLASAAIGAAVGTVVGGLIGTTLGAYIAGRNDVLGLGGRGALLDKTKEHWSALKNHLDKEAAWPIGFVYANNPLPIDQHQVLAIGYNDYGNNKGKIRMWDNNFFGEQHICIDMNGQELIVTGSNHKYEKIKGIISENYSFQMPPEGA